MCVNCLPEADAESDGAGGSDRLRKYAEPKKPLCAKHGPNGSCTTCMAWQDSLKLRVKRQADPLCKRASIANAAARAFTSYVIATQFSVKRCGWLFGRVKRSGAIVVEAIYEPAQSGTRETLAMLDDPLADKVDAIAQLLGWQRIGFVQSAAKRECNDLSALEVRQAAAMQAKYGDSFVTVLVKEVEQEGSQQSTATMEAYQVSEQCVALFVRDAFAADQGVDSKELRMTKEVYVEGVTTSACPLEYFLVPVPIQQRDGVLSAAFPFHNRAPQPQPNNADLNEYLTHTMRGRAFIEQLKDFQALLYLTSVLDLEHDFPTLIDAIVNNKPDALEGFKLIISHAVGIA